jgi:hypothetical protein
MTSWHETVKVGLHNHSRTIFLVVIVVERVLVGGILVGRVGRNVRFRM